jgi:hypothetical protein
MKTKKNGSALPARLDRGRKQFERWRATRQKRRIPESLWKLAEGLGAEFGVNRTSRALRINYEHLKRRVTLAAEENGKLRVGVKASGFVPLMSAGIVGGEGAAEYKGVDGSWMRIEWKGPTPELAGLSESFFFGGRSCSR